MSHRKLLMQRIGDAIEAGHYRTKGTPRAKEAPKSSPSEDKPESKREPTEKPAPAKREPLDHGSFVQGLAARRRDAVSDSVHKALDEKFKKR